MPAADRSAAGFSCEEIRYLPSSQKLYRIPEDDPRLLEGVRLFNAEAYFESHEVWEALWHDIGGEEREFLQGLIQLAAAYYHLRRRNRSGADYLYERARHRLARWAPAHVGIDIAAFLAQVDLEFSGAGESELRTSSPPVIRLVDE